MNSWYLEFVSAFKGDVYQARRPESSNLRISSRAIHVLPLPVGNWKINGVLRNPSFHYNPDLFWDANATDQKAMIKPGPNNPVGLVWITLSKEHYGIHGSPEPSRIGHSESHGCIRLTNWDALELAGMVRAGTPAKLME